MRHPWFKLDVVHYKKLISLPLTPPLPARVNSRRSIVISLILCKPPFREDNAINIILETTFANTVDVRRSSSDELVA